MPKRIGDKVRVKDGPYKGLRGLITSVRNDSCQVRLADGGRLIELKCTEILNYSLAARKAWLKMPRRKVGRPFGTRVCDRVSVTLRIDRELWKRFQEAESMGLVVNRTATINGMIRSFLDRIPVPQKKAS